jgi:hypothetical protein
MPWVDQLEGNTYLTNVLDNCIPGKTFRSSNGAKEDGNVESCTNRLVHGKLDESVLHIQHRLRLRSALLVFLVLNRHRLVTGECALQPILPEDVDGHVDERVYRELDQRRRVNGVWFLGRNVSLLYSEHDAIKIRNRGFYIVLV